MNAIKVTMKVAPLLAALLLLPFCMIDYAGQVVDIPAAPAMQAPTVDQSVVAEAESAGVTCRTEPVLTDVIVVQDAATDATSIITFDEAFAGAEAGSLRVILYCS